MKSWIALALLTASIPASAAETGFAIGNELEAVPIQGEAIVSCNDGLKNDHVQVLCREVILNPLETSLFVTEPGGKADKVTLTATHEDGSTRTKSEAFDPATGQSKKKFNLWIATLLQRPLLEWGVNRVEYKLTRGNSVEREGEFTATIRTGERKTCRTEFITSHMISDCQGTNICDRYFRQQNWCQ